MRIKSAARKEQDDAEKRNLSEREERERAGERERERERRGDQEEVSSSVELPLVRFRINQNNANEATTNEARCWGRVVGRGCGGGAVRGNLSQRFDMDQ